MLKDSIAYYIDHQSFSETLHLFQITLCSIATSVTCQDANVPKVFESVDESAELKTSRHPRHPEILQRITNPRLYSPVKFDFKAAVQQDLQLLRYYRQQQADNRNLKDIHVQKERIAPISPIASALLRDTKQNAQVSSPENRLRVARKLTPSNYQINDMHNEEVNANVQLTASPRAIYVYPTKLQPDQNLRALNDLIGKNPNAQLEGLKQLLGDPSQVKLIMPNGPAPFQTNNHNVHQHSVDVHANIAPSSSEESKELVFKPDQHTFNKIQAELDASTRIHVQNAIAAAQQQARAHVEEQHKAIAKAQEEARRIAMEKIRAHNEAIINQAYDEKKEASVSESDVQEVPPTQEAESRIHNVPTTQHVITIVEEPQQNVALIQAHNEALLHTQQSPEEKVYHQQQHLNIPTHQVVYEPVQQSQEELQKLAEESNKAYGGEHEEVSKSKCKTFVDEKLEMFRQQFCNHLKYSPKVAVKNEALKDFVFELNCAKIERATNFFSTKLREMYRENRKAFFSLCYFNVSSANIQLTNEFVFSNNLTDFNENLLRQKRETGDDEIGYGDYGNDESERDDYYYYDEYDNNNATGVIVNATGQQNSADDRDTLPSASAQKLVLRPHNKHKSAHNHQTKQKLPSYYHINHSPKYSLIPESEIKKQNEGKTDKEPTNVIVINNSNDNHNHGANVKFHHSGPPVAHRPLKHRHKIHKRPHVHHKIIIRKKPSVKKILRVSKKVDTVLSKLGHNILRLR